MSKNFIFFILLSFSSWVAAIEIEIDEQMTQEDFKDFIKELGVGVLFNPMAPAEPSGLLGFDISVEAMITPISDEKDFWKKAVKDHDPPTAIIAPRLHVQKGLPFGLDVGAMYVAVPNSSIRLWGLEAKYALLEGTMLTPALSVRASYSQLEGVDDMDLSTLSLDVLVSKGILMVTPYAGASMFGIRGHEKSNRVELDDISEVDYKTFVGLQFSPFPLIIVNGEISFGEVPQYGLKVGVKF